MRVTLFMSLKVYLERVPDEWTEVLESRDWSNLRALSVGNRINNLECCGVNDTNIGIIAKKKWPQL